MKRAQAPGTLRANGKRILLVGFTAVFALQAAETREEPVGLILSAVGGKVLRSNTETPLAARAGDILFSVLPGKKFPNA